MFPVSRVGQPRSIALIWLAVTLVPAVAVTTALTRVHRAERASLASQEAARGDTALQGGRAVEAVADFRDALTYARDNPTYRFKLAQALSAAGQRAEARNYYQLLWDAEPGDGRVNLALARLAADDDDWAAASRYYHAAIEGAWDDNVSVARRSVRVELARLLLQHGDVGAAQPELVALASDPPPDPEQSQELAAMLARADLTSRALTIYAAILAEHPKDVAALSGAGEAEFRLKNYPGAAVDLARALAYGATDPAVRADGEVANLVVSADPFQRRLGIRGRANRAAAAFAAATTRLAACQAAHPDAAELTALSDAAETLRPAAAAPKLARDPDRIDEAMDLVFSIESSVTARCGAPTGLDRALQILAETSKGER